MRRLLHKFYSGLSNKVSKDTRSKQATAGVGDRRIGNGLAYNLITMPGMNAMPPVPPYVVLSVNFKEKRPGKYI